MMLREFSPLSHREAQQCCAGMRCGAGKMNVFIKIRCGISIFVPFLRPSKLEEPRFIGFLNVSKGALCYIRNILDNKWQNLRNTVHFFISILRAHLGEIAFLIPKTFGRLNNRFKSQF